MASSFTRPDSGRVQSFVGARGGLAAAGLGGEAEVFHQRDLAVALCGNLRFVDPDLQAQARDGKCGPILLECYRLHGESMFERLSGAFALALTDESSGQTLLAIDRMGIFSLCYNVAHDCLVFGSTVDAIRAHPGVSSGLHLQAIYNYVYFHMIPGPDTIYAGHQRLSPGTYLLFRDGKATVNTYWEMRYQERDNTRVSVLKDEFLNILEGCVAEAAEGFSAGAFLSGGTDSSTLAGMLGRVTGKPARTYSIGFEAEGYDEMEYARIAARHFKTQHREYYVTPDDVVEAIPGIAEIYDQPFGNSSAVPAYYCARLAKSDGVERLLGGDGGDELFGGNQRYAKQYIFSFYDHLPSRLRKGLIEPLTCAIPAGDKLPVFRKFHSYVKQASVPMPARLETYNLLDHFGAGTVFNPDFLENVDPNEPGRLLDDCYQRAHAQTLINRMLALDLKFTLADNDLPKVMKTCELAGVSASFPMLNDQLVAFSARLAPGLKLKRTQLRFFFKEALRGFLPDEIIAKRKHGFGLPFGPWVLTHERLRACVRESLEELKKRGVIRPEFIEALFAVRLTQHPGFYGPLVWVLVMLEQWFRYHDSPQTRSVQ